MHPLDHALKLSQKGSLDKAENILRGLPQDDIRVQYNLGYYDIRAGQLLRGMTGMNAGRWLNVFGSPPVSSKPIWKDEPLSGMTVLFHSEGGLGDHIINVRFAKNFADMGARVVVSTDPSLFSVFRELPFIYQLVDSRGAQFIDHDYWVPGMAAPLVLGLNDVDPTPYIPRKTSTKTDKLKVGIRWSGNPQFEHEQNRRFDPTPLIDLHKIDGVQVYSFQRDENLVDLPESIIDLKDELHDWSDTQRWLSEMDVVVTSCTSVAHMSAAMGIDTRVIIPCLPYYIWANKDIKWYDSVTTYKQVKYRDWNGPLNKVTQDIRKFVIEDTQCTHKSETTKLSHG